MGGVRVQEDLVHMPLDQGDGVHCGVRAHTAEPRHLRDVRDEPGAHQTAQRVCRRIGFRRRIRRVDMKRLALTACLTLLLVVGCENRFVLLNVVEVPTVYLVPPRDLGKSTWYQ